MVSLLVEIFLYASPSKIDALRPRGWWTQFGKLTVKVKAPVVEAGVDFTQHPSEYRRLRRLQRSLDKDRNVVPFDADQEAYSSVVSFEGAATLTLESGAVWLALERGRTALLLGGSARNVIGSAKDAPAAEFSPSIATIQVASQAVATTGEEQQSLPASLSYMWQQVRRQGLRGSASLRNVRGHALFVAAYVPVKAQIRRGTRSDIDRLVIASPIYVQQV